MSTWVVETLGGEVYYLVHRRSWLRGKLRLAVTRFCGYRFPS